jgi:urease accessory protein
MQPGHGRVRLAADGAFAELAAAYPLKLLAPRLAHPRVAAVYILSYGGGLVGGDRVQLDLEVESGAILLALTQACLHCTICVPLC